MLVDAYAPPRRMNKLVLCSRSPEFELVKRSGFSSSTLHFVISSVTHSVNLLSSSIFLYWHRSGWVSNINYFSMFAVLNISAVVQMSGRYQTRPSPSRYEIWQWNYTDVRKAVACERRPISGCRLSPPKNTVCELEPRNDFRDVKLLFCYWPIKFTDRIWHSRTRTTLREPAINLEFEF